MGGIKAFIVLAMAALNFPVMPWRVRADQLMPDPILLQTTLKESGFVPVRGETVGKFGPIIGLDALNGAGKGFHKVIHKEGGGIGAVFFKSFHIAPSGILINGSILEELLTDHVTVYKTGGRDKFHIYLKTLTGILHLFVRLGDILGIRRMDSHDALFFQEAVETGNGAGITALHELDPKYHKSCVRVTPAHIQDQLDFIGGMLVRMMERSSGAVAQGLNRAVKAAFPAVDILSVGLVSDGSISNPILFSVMNKR